MPAKTMLAVVKEKAGPGIAIKKIPIPKPKKGEVLVKVLYTSICGTDIGIYDWIPWAASHIKPPTVIGHELVGEVVAVNTDHESYFKTGDLVSSETHIFCDICYQCCTGKRHICENMELFGIGRNGGFAEYATIPIRTCWRNHNSIPIEVMSVQEPLGNAVHVVTKAEVPGKRVLVLGLGPTGLCASLVAQVYGAAKVHAVDPNSYRRRLARKLGVPQVAAELDHNRLARYDVVFDMSGAASAIFTAFRAVRIAGTIMAFGIPKQKITIDWGKYIIDKELTIQSVFGRRIWKSWYQTLDLLKSGKINLKKIITHQFALVDFEEAMAVMKSGECGKIVLKVS